VTQPHTQRPYWLRFAVDFADAAALIVALTTTMLLTLEWPQLTIPSRIACAVLAAVTGGWWAIRQHRTIRR
jgi:hypothetical protein